MISSLARAIEKNESEHSKFVTSPNYHLSLADFKERLERNDLTKNSRGIYIGPNPIRIVPPDVSDGRDLFVLRCVG